MNEIKSAPGFEEDMKEIFESYLIEAREIVDHLSQDLLALEKNPNEMNLLNNIFRGMHTLKGTSSFLGFSQMTELTHASEDLLNKIRKGEIIADENIIDLLIEIHKTAVILLNRIENRNLQSLDFNDIMQKIQVISQKHVITPMEIPSQPLKANNVNIAGAPEITVQQSVDSTIRVDVERLDDLMNLVGELVLARNRLAQATFALVEKNEQNEISKQIAEVSDQVDFVTTELQSAVMKTRMVPIEKVFSGLPLLAREVMRTTGKEVDLQIYGKETELDKSIIEELKDPLIHMLRNAIDHGIELPAEREKLGKPSHGTVIINAEREGNYILITMEDDGKGINATEVKQRALDKGLITEAQLAELSDAEALNLIFIPGFSTKKDASNVSGRGVGMDIVKTNIGKLKGIVQIESEVEKGTIIILKVPLTLAIIQGLLMQVGSEIFAVPLSAVLEIVRLNSDEIYTIQGREVIRVRDAVLPLARMSEIIGKTKDANRNPVSYVVIVGWAEKRIGLLVDSLKGQKEIVIKSLGSYLGDVVGIAGSTILGDGSVILVIDVGQFIELFAKYYGKVA